MDQPDTNATPTAAAAATAPTDATAPADSGPKKSFWGGLLRRASRSGDKGPAGTLKKKDAARPSQPQPLPKARPRPGNVRHDRDHPRRAVSADGRRNNSSSNRRQRPDDPQDAGWETEPEQQRAKTGRPAAKGKAAANGRPSASSPAGAPAAPAAPPTWPPRGIKANDQLTPREATARIARGAPVHTGRRRPIAHMPSDKFFSLYTTTTTPGAGHDDESDDDAADPHDAMTQLMSMKLRTRNRDRDHSGGTTRYPWETLEQPSYAFYYGRLGGTVTLTQWAFAAASSLPATVGVRDSGVVPRPMDLAAIMERLRELQGGLEDDDPGQLYKTLYRRILRDPDRILSPHKTLDRQMTDLILVLSRPDHWIDFTNPRNQVVTRFIFDVGAEPIPASTVMGGESSVAAEDPAEAEAQQQRREQYRLFFHQLLLSVELELRIQSRQHRDWARDKLLHQIPPPIQWNLALARRWRQNVRVDAYGPDPADVRLRYKRQKRQVKVLKRFARLMNWPNREETVAALEARERDDTLDSVSSDSFAFFSGLVVPGPTLPFLMMNSLIDVDPDPATDELALLSHIHPNCGFQYRSSCTYWSAACIVGKVLAPTCRSVAGWVGPARPTTDLARSQIARVRARRPIQTLLPQDVASMAERSDPLGPEADRYPVSDYFLVEETRGYDDVTVKVEMLGLRAAATAVGSGERMNGPRVFDATLQVAVDGVSWPLKLAYDVSFVTAWPCRRGPHPLFFDYVFTRVGVHEIMGVRDWGRLYSRDQRERRAARGNRSRLGTSTVGGEDDDDEFDEERVLLVEAFGAPDHEVLARAWCAHWGLGAVVADVRRTCIACAIREAYAATMMVVILVEGREYEHDHDE